MVSLKRNVGTHDFEFVTLDTLRYDIAQDAFRRGMVPNLAKRLPKSGWERRHSPGSFTFAAHQAFFAGFLPTPAKPGKHERLFAASFLGSETTTNETFCFEEPNIVEALRNRGYHTICIGGVGFFNKQTQLGSILPNLFDESHWSGEISVTDPESTENQVALALRRLDATSQRVFLFINVSALHQPNYFYLDPENPVDLIESQTAALAYVDVSLAPLWKALESRGPGVCVVCSDHGTAYGEDGYVGHRVGHQVVWDVPYAEFVYKDSGS